MNAYERLGVSSSASSADVRRAYRKRALQLHPDKNPDNPAAAAEFTELQRAYALLCDDEARAALDAWLEIERQKEERGKMRSEKRQKMAEDLEARERRADDVQPRETEVKLKLQRQLDRLKRQAEKRQWQTTQARQARRGNMGANVGANVGAAPVVKEDAEDDDEYLKPLGVRLFPAGATTAGAASASRSSAVPAAKGEAETRILGAMMGAR